MDKKRGKNPVKKDHVNSREAGQARGGGEISVWQPNCLYPKQKTSIPLTWELRIAPVLLGPQVGGRAVSREPRPSILQAGLLALGSSYSRRLPGAFNNPSGLQPVSSPITAAGPRRFRTVFPFNPVGPVKYLLSIPFYPGCEGKSPETGRIRRRSGPPPGPGPRGSIWLGEGTRRGDRPDDSWSRNVPYPWPR